VGFEIRGLVADHGVGRRVRLVEPVAGEEGHQVKIPVALASLTLRAIAPAVNLARIFAISSFFFLPIACRNTSASPRVKPPSWEAICITCSWYTMTPYVSLRIGSSSGSG